MSRVGEKKALVREIERSREELAAMWKKATQRNPINQVARATLSRVKSWRATTQEREGKAKAAFRSKPWGLMALALALGVGAGLVARAIQRQRAKGCAGEPNGLAKERSSGRARFLQ